MDACVMVNHDLNLNTIQYTVAEEMCSIICKITLVTGVLPVCIEGLDAVEREREEKSPRVLVLLTQK